LELLTDLGPDRIVTELAALTGETPAQALLPHLFMPAHHDVRSSSNGQPWDPRWNPSLQPSARRRRCWMADRYSDGRRI
jgi:hypothetical protein